MKKIKVVEFVKDGSKLVVGSDGFDTFADKYGDKVAFATAFVVGGIRTAVVMSVAVCAAVGVTAIVNSLTGNEVSECEIFDENVEEI